MAPITGFMDSVDIILYCLVIGGYIALVMKTGALDAAIGTTMKRLEGKVLIMLIPTLMLIFSVAGAAFGIEEETLPFFPVLIPIFIAAGYDSLVGLSVIKIGAALGVMASIANPFAVAIASSNSQGSPWQMESVSVFQIPLFLHLHPDRHHIYGCRLRKENPEGSYEIPGLRTG